MFLFASLCFLFFYGLCQLLARLRAQPVELHHKWTFPSHFDQNSLQDQKGLSKLNLKIKKIKDQTFAIEEAPSWNHFGYFYLIKFEKDEKGKAQLSVEVEPRLIPTFSDYNHTQKLLKKINLTA